MVKQYFRTALRRPAFWFVSVVLFGYGLLGYCIPSVLFSSASSMEDPLLFLNYANFFSIGTICSLILPLYALFMHQDILFFHKETVLIKFKTKSSYWSVRIGMLFLNALCYVLLLYFIFFLRCLAFGILEDAGYFIVPLLLNFVSQTLSFSLFCLLTTFLTEFLHNQAVGFVLVFLLMAVEFYFQKVYSIPGMLLRGIGLSLKEPSQAVFGIGITICVLAVLCFVLISTADKRDYLSKRVP